jgi:hypothetical protein
VGADRVRGEGGSGRELSRKGLVESLMKLHDNFTQMVVAALPGALQQALKRHNACVGGGFVRDIVSGKEPKDIDVFCNTDSTVHGIQDFLEWEIDGARTKENKNSVTIDSFIETITPIQIVNRWYVWPPEELVKTFDWGICQAAVYWDGRQWQGVCTQAFIDDLANAAATYMSPNRDEDPGASVLRMVKLARKGYTITEESIAGCLGRMFNALLAETPMTLDHGAFG